MKVTKLHNLSKQQGKHEYASPDSHCLGFKYAPASILLLHVAIRIPARHIIFYIFRYSISVMISSDYMVMIAALPSKLNSIPSGKSCNSLLISPNDYA